MNRCLGLLLTVLVSTPAAAWCRKQVGHLYLPFPDHHCREVVTVVLPAPPLPPPPPIYVQMPAPPMVEVEVDVDEESTPLPPPPVVVVAAPPRVQVVERVVEREVEPQEEPRARFAVKWGPAVSAPISSSEGIHLGTASWAHSPGTEVRLGRYWAIRADLEMRNGARSWDIPGLKLSLFSAARVRPYGSVSLSLNDTAANPGHIDVGVMAATGLDITIYRWIFVNAEARYRTYPGNCCALPRVTGVISLGAQFL